MTEPTGARYIKHNAPVGAVMMAFLIVLFFYAGDPVPDAFVGSTIMSLDECQRMTTDEAFLQNMGKSAYRGAADRTTAQCQPLAMSSVQSLMFSLSEMLSR